MAYFLLGSADVQVGIPPCEQHRGFKLEQRCTNKSDSSQSQYSSVSLGFADRSCEVPPLRGGKKIPLTRSRQVPYFRLHKTFARIADVRPATATVELITPEDDNMVALQTPTTPKRLSQKWRDIQGANDWKDLLDPLDPDLKSEIIKHGELAQLCYDAFDYDHHSEFCGSCKHNPKKLLKEYGLRHEDYEITKYLYATSAFSLPTFFRKPDSNDPWSRDSNWIGFVAISTSDREIQRLGRREIVVAWRGTVTRLDWLADLQNSLCPASLDPRSVGRSTYGEVRVETGFLSLYTASKPTARYNKSSAREQLLIEIRRLIELYQGEEMSISLTGHSLGAALAVLSGYDLAESGINVRPKISSLSTSFCPTKEAISCTYKKHNISQSKEPTDQLLHQNKYIAENDEIPITVFSFGGPRVGNSAFRDRLSALGVKVLRIVNVNDIVTKKVPGVMLNEKFELLHDWVEKLPWTYSHGGVELAIDSQHSPYLKPSIDPSDFHNLEAYLHLIDGHVGHGRKWSGLLSRDPALVNKNSNLLRNHYKIPGFWRQDKDKGMVKHRNGRIKFRGREAEDIPPYLDDTAK